MKNKFRIDSKTIIFILVLVLVGMVLFGINYCFFSPSPINKYIASNIYKTPANSAFSDDNFYQCVVDYYNIRNFSDVAYTSSLSDEQLAKIPYLTCRGLKNMDGIEKLTSLEYLNVSSNQLTSLDVSKNTALIKLDVSSNQLTSLDVSKNTALTTLNVELNRLTNLDVSKNTALEYLNASSNQITSLDVSGATSLTELDVSYNQLTSLDVSKNTALTTLNVKLNRLTNLDVSKNTALIVLEVGVNRLTNLDVGDNLALTELNVNSNQLTSLEVNKNTALTELNVNSNQITSLDVSKNTSLTKLDVSSNQNTSLDVSNNIALTKLYVVNNKLTSLDVSKNTSLTILEVGGNYLTSLDVSKNTALTTLDVSLNQIRSWDVSKNTALTTLDVSSNYLTSLDVSKNTALTELDVGSNYLTSLDVSKNTALTELDVGSNYLTSLEVSGATSLTTLKADDNKLTNLDVSKNTLLTDLVVYENQITNLDVSKNTALEYLNVHNNQITSLEVNNNTALKYLEASSNQITSLDVSKNTALTGLYVSINYLTSLDVSKNTALTSLYVNSNKITSLDVSKNTKLKYLEASSNQITNLDVSKNTALITLEAYSNQLTSLDVSKNTALTYLYAYSNQLTSLDLSNNDKLSTLLIYSNPYNLKLKAIFKGDSISLGNNKLVKLPSHFSPTVTYEVSDGLSLNGEVITANEAGTQTYKMISKSPNYEETYTVEVVDITSDKYVVDKSLDYIEVGSDTDEVVLSNITVENGEAVIEEDELIVKDGEDELKRFKLLRLSSSVYDLSNEYIYVGRDDDQIVIDNIETNASMVIESNVLKISYGENYSVSYKLVRHNIKYDYIYTLNSDSILDSVEIINGDTEIKDNNLVISYKDIELDRLPILTVTSSVYKIIDSFVYTGFKDISLDNFNKSDDLELSVLDNRLEVMYNGVLLDKVPIYGLSIDSDIMRVSSSKNVIYFKDSIEYSYKDFSDAITWNVVSDDMKINVYNINKELVSEGNVTEGYTIKILYKDEVMDTYDIELKAEYVDYKESSKVEYTEEYGIDILKYLNINNSFKNIRDLFETDGVVSIKDKDNNLLEEANNVKTGDKFVINFSDSEYFIHLSVKGDVRGVGKIGEEDVVEAYNILRGDKDVEDCYKIAGDINEDGKLKINDVAKLHQYVKNKITSLE